jgi:AraC-like DNA-binding protein
MSPTAPIPHDDALERLLGDVAISIRSQHRVHPIVDQAMLLGADGLSIVYVLEGGVRLPSGLGLPEHLSSGDALLVSGHRTLTMRVPAGSGVLVSHLDWAESAAHLSPLLPDTVWIHRFDEYEPAAAALAHHLGTDGKASCETGSDLVICRMMATTLLQSVIRAWSKLGCAPQGWPSSTDDPFLDRVIEAVRRDPGRDWTVESMAAVSALSRSVFAERFRTAFGLSPAQHVAEIRMRAARALLIDGRGVSEVSRELGYGSDDGFSRAFRRHTGMTPSAWRSRGALASV